MKRVKIYDRLLEIRAEKLSDATTGGNKALRGSYKHPFHKRAEIWGLPNGSLLIIPKDGQRLWEEK